MTRKATPKAPEVPWGETGDEVQEAGIGLGFVQWDKHGESLRGMLLNRWRSGKMRSPAVTIELTEIPTVPIYHTDGSDEPQLMTPKAGEKVNVSLSFDLDRKLTRGMEGEEVGIMYSADQPTPKGSMRVFRVFTFGQGELPF